ncbi:FMN-binding split barrel [Glarea lozoyensis ATCC 20868]|uniref:FMN-binding split barrel n=1 Tax=Glarea lozoyensis (strain ATCC 20868 / MF5171) TaxID=1116229 RepID=S3DFV6_GLAL2|nr:FMN-binding split barrel [Glarea lozoyensis ATCC 20868]EPE25528.1 FMN-binding split barrel [Glarea lozoyensis ATCC 20868]
MLFSILGFASLLPLTTAILPSPLNPQHIFSNPTSPHDSTFRIPTSYESAVLARRILHLTPHSTLSTIFPSPEHASEQRPSGLGGMPIGLMDYIADCEDSGNPTILAINIATSFKNVAAGSNISLSLQWVPPHLPDKRIQSEGPRTAYSAANLPRFSLLGYLEKIDEAKGAELKECFLDTHPDSKYWLPGNRIHTSEWVRLVVQDVYWVGGFGDRAYIGWIDAEEWRNVTRKEWEDVRLPGEHKGWKEWAVQERDWEL